MAKGGINKDELPVRISRKISVDLESGCWNWVGCVQSNGYGRVWDGNCVRYAHRVLYTLLKGVIQKSLDLDHLCRNRRCVNPDHLEAVTRSENLKRGLAGENIAAPLREKTHCPRGHEYSGDNLSKRNGRRHCKACQRISYHKRKSLWLKA